jgi:amino acid permease
MKPITRSAGSTFNGKRFNGFGIAAIVGAGIFSTIGKAKVDGGPAVIFLLFTALACSFTLLMQSLSMVPVSKCVYVFLCCLGELIAWIIGWALIMEWNITVAIPGVIILQDYREWTSYPNGFKWIT